MFPKSDNAHISVFVHKDFMHLVPGVVSYNEILKTIVYGKLSDYQCTMQSIKMIRLLGSLKLCNREMSRFL